MRGRINRKKKNNTRLVTQVACIAPFLLRPVFFFFFSSLFRLPRVRLNALSLSYERELMRRDKQKGR